VKTQHLLGMKISLAPYQEFIDHLIEYAILNKSAYVCVANVHMLIEAHKAASYTLIVNNADLVTPDGIPLTWALKFLYDIKQDRVAGMDLLPDLNATERKNIPVAFYGGTLEMLKKADEYVKYFIPNLLVVKCSPPFRPLTTVEEEFTINMLNDSGQD
jgi:N-acetylglucosaminyldiphosphoundecaprenol N-acetyl-beta-D-mannosaminyltransferase